MAAFASVIAGLAVAVAPLLAFGALLGTAAVLVMWLYPKASAAGVVVIVLFARMAAAATPFADPLDDAAVALFSAVVMARLILEGRRIRVPPWGPWFVLFLVSGMLSSLLSDVPLGLTVQDAYLLLKGVLLGFVISQLQWTERDARTMVRVGKVVIIFVFVAVALNIALDGVWTQYFSSSEGEADIRAGLLTPFGPFGHPGFLGQAMALVASATFAYMLVVRRTRGGYLLLGTSILVLGATLRRKAVVGLLASLAAVGVLVRTYRGRFWLWMVIVLPLLVVVGWDAIQTIVSATYEQYVLRASQSARSAMYSSGYQLMLDHMPFGAGLGRFGTYTAFSNYSPLYYDLGLDRVYGLGPDDRFATDTFWPAIMGEAGLLGLVGFFGGLVVMAKRAFELGQDARATPYVRFIGVLGAAWSLEFLVESVASPVYSAPPLYGVFFGALGVAESLRRRLSGGPQEDRTGTLEVPIAALGSRDGTAPGRA